MSSSTSPKHPSDSTWSRLVEIAGHLSTLYAPGDDSEELCRCDVRMVLEANRKAIEALDGQSEVKAEDSLSESSEDPLESVTALLRVYHKVLRGLYAETRDLALGAAELASETERLHGPA